MKCKQISSLIYILNHLLFILQHNLSSISFCESLDVFLVFLQQRDQEVCGQVSVLEELLLTHLYVIHGPVETEDLLHLTFDGELEG